MPALDKIGIPIRKRQNLPIDIDHTAVRSSRIDIDEMCRPREGLKTGTDLKDQGVEWDSGEKPFEDLRVGGIAPLVQIPIASFYFRQCINHTAIFHHRCLSIYLNDM